MQFLRLKGENFRNFSSIDLTFNPNFNIIIGDNGSGKTTIIEMLTCLARGKSFRTHLSSPIIQHHQSMCTLFGQMTSDTLSTSVGFQKMHKGKTTLRIGYGNQKPSLYELVTLLPIQLFHPECHDLLNSGPKLRRQFIDWGLFYTNPNFIKIWSRFHASLKQRNAALLQKQSEYQIQIWNNEIVKIGEMLSVLRADYIKQLTTMAHPLMKTLIDSRVICFHYDQGWPHHQSLFEALNYSLEKDRQYGYTRVGPHRFDLTMTIKNLFVNTVLSRGEQKRLICALYIAQGQIFKALTKKNCVYLFDDILSELDAHYQKKVLFLLSQLDAQIFVTVLDLALLNHLPTLCQETRFQVKNGIIY